MANEVSVEISIEERNALRALTQLTKKVDDFAEQSQKSVKTLDLAFASFAGNLASQAVVKGFGFLVDGTQKLITVGKEFVDLASIQEDAVNSLNTQLAIAGRFSEETSRSLQEYASELQQVTKFGDEAILSQIAFAQAMGANVEQSKQIVSAAADMASALDIDLNSAVRNISKTLGGYAGELGEVIPELKNLTQEQLRAGEGVALLADRFQGAAQGATQTFSGALTQLQNTIGDTKESFGGLITQNPLVIAALKGIQEVFKNIQSQVGQNKGLFDDLVNNGVLVFIDAIGFAIEAVAKFNSSIRFVQNFADKFNVAFNFVRQQISQLVNSVAGGLNKLNELVGLENKLLTDLERGSEARIKTIQKEINESIAAVSRRERAEREFTDTFKRLSDEVRATLKARVEEAKEKYGEDADSFVENLNRKQEARLLDQESQQEAFDFETLLEEARKERQANLDDQELAFKELKQDKQFQILEKGLGREEALRETIAARELARNGKKEEAKNKLVQALDRAEKQITKNEAEQQKLREQNLNRTLGVITQLTGSANKQLFRIGKAASLARAIINGEEAVTVALKSAPPPFNYGLAAAVAAAVAQNISNIASQSPPSFQTGGIVPGTSFSGDNVLARVNSGELILNRQQQQNLFNQLNQGTPGGTIEQANSIAQAAFNQPIVVEIDGREVARAVRTETENGFKI